MLRLQPGHREAMIATAIRALPNEGCGLLVGRADEVVEVVASPNVADSARVYEIDPRVLLRTFRDAEAGGLEVIGVFHSHTHSAAYPSPTDVAQAPDPAWHYVLVSLADAVSDVRSYRITGGAIAEEELVLDGDEGHAPPRRR
ncbi:MAG TPA: M67 family metallopeptidase [Acidimicrobiales bacterium]|nr:M67 family metallopeptidase [Acidimicrobiales bacterium]